MSNECEGELEDWREQSEIMEDRAEYYEFPFYESKEQYEMENHDLIMRLDERTLSYGHWFERLELRLSRMEEKQDRINEKATREQAWVNILKWVFAIIVPLIIGWLSWLTYGRGFW